MKDHNAQSICHAWFYLMSLHYTQKAHDHTAYTFKVPNYSLQMSFKAPHNFMVIALGHSVNWP